MSQKNSLNNLKESDIVTSKKLKLEKSEKIKVLFPSSIFGDVAFLHNKYKGREWSGYLYYKHEGNTDNPADMIVTIKDFVLLDIGGGASTDIKPSGEQVVDMFERRPIIIEEQLKQGLLHSHHDMQVFYSGTDWDTLLENASNYDFFLSIIVNAKGDIIGKISQRGEVTTVNSYKYRFMRDEISKEPVTETKEVIFVYDCEMVFDSTIHTEIKLVEAHEETKKKLMQEASLLTRHTFDRVPTANKWDRDFDSRFDSYKRPESVQTTIFNSLEEEDVKPKSIKSKVETFIKACMILDVDLDFTEHYTYQECKEEFELSYKQTGIEKDYEEELMIAINEIFENVFVGSYYPDLKEITQIEKTFNTINKDGVVERIVAKVFKEYLSNYKLELINEQ